MKKNIMRLSLISGFALPMCVMAAPSAVITSGADSGDGTLRDALASGAIKIVIKPKVSQITLKTALVYDGSRPLSIKGSGQFVDGSGIQNGDPILHVTEGADLSISGLDFAGPGGYSIEYQGGGVGIQVDVPSGQEGLVNVKLTNVSISNTGDHGLLVSDCTVDDGEEACGDGNEGEGSGSPASVFLQMTGVTIDGVGFGKQDGDGARVNERGEGDIYLAVTNSTFANVGGDGIELDEGQAGHVMINVRNSTFDSNGAYCFDYGLYDPILEDPNCDDGGDPDVDDAFDIDEAGPGGITGTVSNVELFDNFDEGLDFDSAGGDGENLVDLDLVNIVASGNEDEAIKVSEEGNASVVVNMRTLDVEGDVEVEEEDAGDLTVTVSGAVIGDDLKLSELGDGEPAVTVTGTDLGDNLEVSENDDGYGTVKLRGTIVEDGDKKFGDNIEEI